MTEQEVWVRAWLASTSAQYSPITAIKAADECLEAYKERFSEPEAKSDALPMDDLVTIVRVDEQGCFTGEIVTGKPMNFKGQGLRPL